MRATANDNIDDIIFHAHRAHTSSTITSQEMVLENLTYSEPMQYSSIDPHGTHPSVGPTQNKLFSTYDVIRNENISPNMERIYHVIENDSAQIKKKNKQKESTTFCQKQNMDGRSQVKKNDPSYRKDEERVYHILSEVEASRSKVPSQKKDAAPQVVEKEEERVYHVLETPDHTCS